MNLIFYYVEFNVKEDTITITAKKIYEDLKKFTDTYSFELRNRNCLLKQEAAREN